MFAWPTAEAHIAYTLSSARGRSSRFPSLPGSAGRDEEAPFVNGPANVDFRDAHDRHWNDGELLYAASRLANADHLYGISAECGLKAIMVQFGMATTDVGPVEKRHRVHVDQLWREFISFAQGAGQANYATRLPSNNPFANWSINQRYSAQVHFTRVIACEHRGGARAVRSLIAELQRDGVFP